VLARGVDAHGGPVLVRNYDYAASRLEGVIWHSRLLERQVIGMDDCLWGGSSTA
jgi:hypothetical protein